MQELLPVRYTSVNNTLWVSGKFLKGFFLAFGETSSQ